VKRDSVTIFFAAGFFQGSSSPKPLKNNIRIISNFWEFAEIFASQSAPGVANLPLVSTTLGANFATRTAGVVDTCGKFATCGNAEAKSSLQCQQPQRQIKGTISDCWHIQVNSKEKIYLFVNSTTQRCLKYNKKFSDWRFFPFATGVNDTSGAPRAANFRKNLWP
jgi:hypothetical protein